jgi:hypothetical protein
MPGLRRVAALLLLTILLTGNVLNGSAEGPEPERRFRWVEGVESSSPREVPNRLSRRGASAVVGEIAGPPVTTLAADFAHYPSAAETVTFIEGLEALYPHLAETLEIGLSGQGRPILGLRLGDELSGDPDVRPALYIDGQHHAREAISQQVVLYTAWCLLTHYGTDPLVTRLLDTRTVYVVPSVNVDGNEIFLAEDFSQRRTANPGSSDDDVDGSFDEDPANGKGYGTYEVYRFDFEQDWANAHPDDPFAEGWQDYYLGNEYLGVFDGQGTGIPQMDDDGDDSTNEDPDGGVDANRNYDHHWSLGDDDPSSDFYRGPEPWSEPEVQAVRDFVLAHGHIITGLSFHSGADVILHPWAWSEEAGLEDLLIYELMSRKGTQLTESHGFLGSPHGWAARAMYQAPASAMDWMYDQGVYAWTPEVYGASLVAYVERIDESGSFRVGVSEGVAFNPDAEDILDTAQRWNSFILYILAATPNMEVTSVSAEDGLLYLTVANEGFIPVQVTVSVEGQAGFHTETEVEYLQASETVVSVEYPAFPPVQTLAVSVSARSLAGTSVRELEERHLDLRIESIPGKEKVTVVGGNLGEFWSLGDFFGDGGWLASGAWDIPEQYHLGPDVVEELFLPVVY